jgi:hypothetical protein
VLIKVVKIKDGNNNKMSRAMADRYWMENITPLLFFNNSNVDADSEKTVTAIANSLDDISITRY